MRALQLAKPGERLSVLCLGAHSDDIEIGAGAHAAGLMERGVKLDVHWCVLSGGGERDDEARASAADFLAKARLRARSRSSRFATASSPSRARRSRSGSRS